MQRQALAMKCQPGVAGTIKQGGNHGGIKLLLLVVSLNQTGIQMDSGGIFKRHQKLGVLA